MNETVFRPDAAVAVPTVAPLCDPHLDPLFWRASRTGVVSAWTKHVPFAHWIVTALRPRSIVELGTHNGVSYAAFCEAVQRSQLDCRCLAVDTWQGDEHAGFYSEEVFHDLRQFHDLRYAGFSELLRSTFDDALDYVPDGSVDLLHIDGLHTYDAVRHDYENWRTKLTNRGVILLHDTNVRERGFGVWRLMEELAQQFPSFQFFHGHGLGIVMVGSDADPGLVSLSRLSGTAASSVRDRFSLLGERWDAEMRATMGQQDWVTAQQGFASERTELQTRCNQLLAQTETLTAELSKIRAVNAELEHSGLKAQGEQLLAQVNGLTAEMATLKAVNAEAEKLLLAQRTDHEKALSDTVAVSKIQARNALEQRAKEERRMRALAAARTDELRKSMQAMGAAEAAVASATVEAWRRRVEAAEVENEQLRDRIQAEQAVARTSAAERDQVLGSTLWRATWPVRAGARLLPTPVRRGVRKSLKAAWWTFSGQIGPRLQQRQAILDAMRQIESSPLFDPVWYILTNPDAIGMDPALHYVTVGGPRHRDPGPNFSAARYMQAYPEIEASKQPPLLHQIIQGNAGDWAPLPLLPASTSSSLPEEVPVLPETAPEPSAEEPIPSEASAAVPTGVPPALHALLGTRFIALEPLRVFAAPHDTSRVTIVTDSVNAGSLFGGVGTALILGVLLARRLNASLRLITRTEPPDAGNIDAVLSVHGVSWDGNVELLHAPPGSRRDIPVSSSDVFLTTSWWTTWATSRSVAARRIAYLLQEDERGFYPLGDDALRAGEMMGNPALLHVVNTGLLLDHLQADGLAPEAIAFEPAFPTDTYHRFGRQMGEARNFFFYARPHNPRNLYWRGLEAIGAAIEEGVLDPSIWRFHFVGKAADDMVLPGGVRPEIIHGLPWADYAGLVRRMDLGLSLMSTPHPSYPPMDLAASGAVVVTNRFGCKVSLTGYSPNILTAEPTIAGLVDGLRQGVALVDDEERRAANYAASGLGRDWHTSFAPVLDRLAERFGG